MKKYRIIELKEPKLTRNTNRVAEFVPDIIFDISYYIEELYITKNKWTHQENKEWRQMNGWFETIKQAEAMIKFHQEEITKIVVKEI